jgi:CO dehydrogenase/acetyl-CoA synthase beta subunit
LLLCLDLFSNCANADEEEEKEEEEEEEEEEDEELMKITESGRQKAIQIVTILLREQPNTATIRFWMENKTN